MLKNLSKESFIFIFIITIFYFFYLKLFIFSFENISILGFFDDENMFLTEQFIKKFNLFNYEAYNTSIHEYGSEFYYIYPIYLIFNSLFDLSTPIKIFYFLSIIHGIFFLIKIFYTKRIFEELKIEGYFFYIFLITIILNPYYVNLIFHLKPDLNLVLALIIISFYNLLIYLKKKNDRYLLLFIFFTAFACAIKYWGFLAFLTILFLNFDKNFKNKFFFLIHLSFGLLFILFNKFLYFIFNFVKKIYDTDQSSRTFDLLNENVNLLFIFNNNFFFIIFVNILIFISYIFFLKFIKKNNVINELFFKLNLFILFYLITNFLYLWDSEVFLKTINLFLVEIRYSYNHINPSNSTYFENILNWIKYFSNFKIFNFFYVFFLIFILIESFKNYKKNLLYKFNAHFISFLIIFILFFLLSVNAGGKDTTIMIFYYVLSLLFFVNIKFFFLKLNLNNYFIFLIIFFIIIYQNSIKKNSYSYYAEFSNLLSVIKSQNINLQEKYSKKIIYICGRNFPILFNNKNFIFVSQEICKNKIYNLNKFRKSDTLGIMILNPDKISQFSDVQGTLNSNEIILYKVLDRNLLKRKIIFYIYYL